MTSESDGDPPAERATTLRALGAVLVAAGVIVGIGVGTWYFHLVWLLGDSLWLAVAAGPLLVICGCIWLHARARRDADRDASIGAAAVAVAALVAWLPQAFARLRTFGAIDVQTTPYWIGNPPTVPVVSVVACAMSLWVVACARWLRIPWHALLRPPRPVAPSVVLAAFMALLLSPALRVADSRYVMLAIETSGKFPGATAPSLRECVRGSAIPGALTGWFALEIGVAFSLLFPAVELLFHGVCRRAFAGASPVRFVVSTAFAAALVLPTYHPSLAIYAGCLITGVLARRTESVVPGIAFWQALMLAPLLWRALVS